VEDSRPRLGRCEVEADGVVEARGACVPRKMVIVRPGQPSTVLEEVAAHDEAQLQERLKQDPDLLPIEEFGLTAPLLVVGRETALPSGSVDLMGLSREGDLVVVEFKVGPQNP